MTTHYFNYIPSAHGEEKRYRHPHLFFEVNQWGMVFTDEGWEIIPSGVQTYILRRVREKNTSIHIGCKAKFIWECYRNIDLYRTQIHFSNGNFLDYSIENLVSNKEISAGERAGIYFCRKNFLKNSIAHMVFKDKCLQEKGLCSQMYWEFMMLPDLIIREYQSYLSGKSISRGRTKTQTQRDTRQEDITELKAQGFSNPKIAEKLGIVNVSVISYWLNKASSEKDI